MPPSTQAHDFEAYQELLRAQAASVGAAGGGEKYEQISKFLNGAWRLRLLCWCSRLPAEAAFAVLGLARQACPACQGRHPEHPSVFNVPPQTPLSPFQTADTEEYLHKLASKIASVKMTAEISKAAARAIEEARAKVRAALCDVLCTLRSCSAPPH